MTDGTGSVFSALSQPLIAAYLKELFIICFIAGVASALFLIPATIKDLKEWRRRRMQPESDFQE